MNLNNKDRITKDIVVYKNFISREDCKKMIQALDGKNYKGRRIRMNDADSGGPRGFNKNEG